MALWSGGLAGRPPNLADCPAAVQEAWDDAAADSAASDWYALVVIMFTCRHCSHFALSCAVCSLQPDGGH